MNTRFIRNALTLIGTIWSMSVTAAIHYVDVNSTNAVAPYTNWTTAANIIQDAVDAAQPGDEIVVTNGVYATGEREYGGSNRVAVVKPLYIRSVNGPIVTTIRGSRESSNTFDHVRCVYLTNGATLVGFTLTNGGTPGWGGGVYGGVLSNCVLVGNVAGANGGGASDCVLYDCIVRQNNAGDIGGGAFRGTLNNCVLRENSSYRGGGAASASLNNCLVISNSASVGAGVGVFARFHSDGSSNGWFAPYASRSELRNCTILGNSASERGGGVLSFYGGWQGDEPGTARLYNCIVYDNWAPDGANHAGFLGSNYVGGQMFYSCTTPLPTNGFGNINNAPLFVDTAAGNFRLQSNSPCINAGRNAYGPAGPDLDGDPRIVGSTVDIGAYEFQSPQSALSYAWLQQYGLPTDGSADFTDSDLDGHNNRQEWRAWTDPTNAASALRLLPPLVTTNGLLVRWQSVVGRSYLLERSASLGAPPNFTPVVSGLLGQSGATDYTDTNAVGAGLFFYRVGVNE